MNHLGLFEGIGGFSLAARWMGWQTVAWCEWDTFCQQVLKHHFPEADQYGDITTTDFTRYAGQIDILTGGFPCQPYSSAGKRLGKEDDRHLWPEMLRAVREIQPRWVVGENVRGLTNWNGGLVFDEVQADLENEGYQVLPFLLPACAVNAPHRRDRIWFIAHATESNDRRNAGELSGPNGRSVCNNISESFSSNEIPGHSANATETERKQSRVSWTRRDGLTDIHSGSNYANTDQTRSQGGKKFGSVGRCWEEPHKQPSRLLCPNWEKFPTQSPLRSRNDGIPAGLDGITFSKWREKSIGAYGNAIVPQVALQIFKAIMQYENHY